MILIKLLQIIQMLLQKFFLTSSSRIRTGVKSSGWGKPSLDWLYYQKKKKKNSRHMSARRWLAQIGCRGTCPCFPHAHYN